MQVAETFEDLEKRLGKDLYPIYKEKLREPLIRDGFGSKGVLMKDKVNGNLMCHECGKTYQHLGTHIKTHKKTAKQYKISHGLLIGGPLTTKEISANRRKIALKIGFVNKNTQFSNGNSSRKGLKNPPPTSYHNKYGTCSPEQLRVRMLILADIVKRSPTQLDAVKYDSALVSILQDWFGTWNNGKKRLGFTIYQKHMSMKKYDEAQLIAILRKWVVDNSKLPSGRMLKTDTKMPSSDTYAHYFGSWNRAKHMSGLSQLLEEIK